MQVRCSLQCLNNFLPHYDHLRPKAHILSEASVCQSISGCSSSSMSASFSCETDGQGTRLGARFHSFHSFLIAQRCFLTNRLILLGILSPQKMARNILFQISAMHFSRPRRLPEFSDYCSRHMQPSACLRLEQTAH